MHYVTIQVPSTPNSKNKNKTKKNVSKEFLDGGTVGKIISSNNPVHQTFRPTIIQGSRCRLHQDTSVVRRKKGGK